jgi:PAS domain-containing protein
MSEQNGWNGAWLRSPGIYHLPRLLSLTTMLVAFFSLLLNWGLPASFGISVPKVFAVPANASLAFLLLALSMRLTRWDQLDFRAAHRAKLSRWCAGGAAFFTLLECVLRGYANFGIPTPFLIAAVNCMLATVVILQASGTSTLIRRAILMVTLLVGGWLVLANIYRVNFGVSRELIADPASALLVVLMSVCLVFNETRNGLVPLSVSSVLGTRAAFQLLLWALVVPLATSWVRLQLEQNMHWSANLLEAVHVLSTVTVMCLLLYLSLQAARSRFEAQRRLQLEFEHGQRTFEALLREGSEVYLTMNCEGRLLACNESARRFLGLRDVSKHAVGIEDLILPESRSTVRALPEELMHTLSSNSVLIFRAANGENMPLYVTAACRMRHGLPEEILLVGRPLPLGLRSARSSQSLMAANY